jgi:hypothetical protein
MNESDRFKLFEGLSCRFLSSPMANWISTPGIFPRRAAIDTAWRSESESVPFDPLPSGGSNQWSMFLYSVEGYSADLQGRTPPLRDEPLVIVRCLSTQNLASARGRRCPRPMSSSLLLPPTTRRCSRRSSTSVERDESCSTANFWYGRLDQGMEIFSAFAHAGTNPRAGVSRVNERRASGSIWEISEGVSDAQGRSGILVKPQQRPAIP